MAKMSLIENKESLARQHQNVYDTIIESRGEVRGSVPALLHSPEIAHHSASLAAFPTRHRTDV